MTLKDLLDRQKNTGEPGTMLAVAALTRCWLHLTEDQQAAEIGEALDAGYGQDEKLLRIALLLQGTNSPGR